MQVAVTHLLLNNDTVYSGSLISKKKNGGTCFDNGGTTEFSCTCEFPYAGGRCETDRCANLGPCQNGGTCVEDKTSGIGAKCDCPANFTGNFCEHGTCGNDIPCYNGGTCNGETCQCSEDNEVAKYHGLSCDMPAACIGNPCQNGGTCIPEIQTDNAQVCFKLFQNFVSILVPLKVRASQL